MLAIFVFGTCGSGKTIFSKALCKTNSFSVFHGGKELRKYMKCISKFSNEYKQLQNLIESGSPLSLEHIKLFTKSHQSNYVQSNLIFDGFPRDLSQLQYIPELLNQYSSIWDWQVRGVEIYISAQTSLERCCNRDDNRIDDGSKDIIEARLNSYYLNTQPAIKDFSSKYPFLKIDGCCSTEKQVVKTCNWLISLS
jgi:adenylate kinase family enzyme